MDYIQYKESPCPIPFSTGVTYQDALQRSEGLKNFLNTVTVTHNLNGIQFSSTHPELNALLDKHVFPDYGRNFFPVVVMVASAGGSGKDTFIKFVSEYLSQVYNSASVSTVDVIKNVYDSLATILKRAYSTSYSSFGNPATFMEKWEKDKTDSYRQFLHDVKDAWSKVGNGPVLYCLSKYLDMARYNIENGQTQASPDDQSHGALFVNNRDLDTYTTMKDWCYQMGIMCIGVKIDGTPQASDFQNDCDSNVDQIPYDVVISNKGTLAELDRKAEVFAELLAYGLSEYGIWIDDRYTFHMYKNLRDNPHDPKPNTSRSSSEE